MSKRAAYFSDGTIIEHGGGRAAFRRAVKLTTDRTKIKVWFRPTDAWREAVKKYFMRFPNCRVADTQEQEVKI